MLLSEFSLIFHVLCLLCDCKEANLISKTFQINLKCSVKCGYLKKKKKAEIFSQRVKELF